MAWLKNYENSLLGYQELFICKKIRKINKWHWLKMELIKKLSFLVQNRWFLCKHFYQKKYDHSVLQGISPTLKYWPHPFLSSPTQKILNLSKNSNFCLVASDRWRFDTSKIYTMERDLYKQIKLAKNKSI